MDKLLNKKYQIQYWNSNYEDIMIEYADSDSEALEIGGSISDTHSYSILKILDDGSKILVTNGNNGGNLKVLRELTREEREGLVDALTNAAEVSGLSIPFESFYYKNRKVILDWVNNGGDGLVEVFTESTEPWLDMRVDEKSPSPREFALSELNKLD